MDKWPDSADVIEDGGKLYSWYITVEGVHYDIHQENNGPIIILVNIEEELIPADFGHMSNVEWLAANNVCLFRGQHSTESHNPDEAARHSTIDHTGATDIIMSALIKEQ